MQNYPVRTSHRRNLEPARLEELLRTHFESAEGTGEQRSATWGAISRLTVSADRKELRVDVSMNPNVPEAVARETIARYNRFLQETTGFSAKERAKRLRKSATSSDAGA